MKAKDFRKLLHNDTKPCATNFWNRQLNVCIDRQHWELAFNSIQETRLQFYTEKYYNVCTIDETDYIKHFFFACTKTKPMWRMVEQEISKRTGTHLEISETISLLRFLDNAHTTREQKNNQTTHSHS